MALESFERLEGNLVRLMDSYGRLQEENRELKAAVDAKDDELLELMEKVSRLEGEKNQVKEKVDSLLGRLDGLLENA